MSSRLRTRKVLLDECVDWRLSKHFAHHQVTSVPRMGWSGLKNGRLLREAQSLFDVLVTVDSNLSFQQHIVRFKIAVIVLRARSNRLQDLEPLVPKLLQTLESAQSGKVVFI